MPISMNICNWAQFYRMQLLALAVVNSGSASQTNSHKQDVILCSWIKQECWMNQKCCNISPDNSFNIDRLTCCQHDNETMSTDSGNFTSVGYSNIPSAKFSVTKEESFDKLKMFLELGARVGETVKSGITQWISTKSVETKQMNSVTLNVNVTTSSAQSLVVIGLIQLNKTLLPTRGALSVVMHSSWKPTLGPLEITYYYLDFEESFERNATEHMVENIAVTCVQQNEDGTWVESDFIGKKCKCSNCTVLGVKQKLESFEIPHRVFLILASIILIVTCIFLGLTASLLVIYRRRLNSRATFIHVCIALSFFLEGAVTTITFLAYLSRQHIASELCEGFAMMLLYFRLTSSCWLLVEGAGLFVKIGLAVYVNYENVFSIRKLKIIAICASLLPGIIIGATAIAEIHTDSLLYHSCKYNLTAWTNHTDDNSTENFSKYKHCYPAGKSHSNILCDVVTCLSFIFNLLISIYIAWVVWKKTANRSNTNQTTDSGRVCTTVKALFTISLSLGLPQFAAFMLRDLVKNPLVRMIVPNALFFVQGPVVFYFYCVKNPELVQAIKLSMQCSELRKSPGPSAVRQNVHVEKPL